MTVKVVIFDSAIHQGSDQKRRLRLAFSLSREGYKVEKSVKQIINFDLEALDQMWIEFEDEEQAVIFKLTKFEL